MIDVKQMTYLIRQANQNDIPRLEELLGNYMQELFHRTWGGTTQLLEQHWFHNEVGIVVAEAANQEIVGFVAWISSYDLHHCMKGGEVIDLYVSPAHRGRGLAMLLITDVATKIQGCGGTYLKGQAMNNPAARRLYRRCARCFAGDECYVSGRAFRRLAELSGKSLREVVSELPEMGWNYEA